MARAGRRTREDIRRHRLQVAKANWWRYAVLAVGLLLCAVVTIAVTTVTGAPSAVNGFFVGVYVTLFGALVAYSLMLDGSHLRSMGAEAERWTSEELGKLDGWRVIDAVEFYDRDVDHVAVGPSTILAVETKWTSRPVQIGPDGVSGLWCDGAGQAAEGARRMRAFLRSHGLEHNVIPLLVLWGPGVPPIEGGCQWVRDVGVVVGKQAKMWRPRLAHLPHWSRSTTGAYEILKDYVHEFDRRKRRSGPFAALRRLVTAD
jgi:hypothetical protein